MPQQTDSTAFQASKAMSMLIMTPWRGICMGCGRTSGAFTTLEERVA